MPKAVFHTRYDEDGASSRTRAYEYVAPLAGHGVEAVVVPRTARGAFEQVLRRAADGAVVVLQKPSLTFAELEALTAAADGRLVVDFDDAISMGYGPNDPADGIESLHATLRRARAVTTGSTHLAAWARSITAAPVEVLPPSLDPGRYRLRAHAAVEQPLLVWIGSSGNHRDLEAAGPGLRALLEAGAVRLRVVSDRPLGWPGAEWAAWSLDGEARLLAEADVGVMPLYDDERSRGRCGYKAVQYEAAGLPVVASPAAGPAEALGAGLLAASQDEWREAISTLAASPQLRAELGAAGRRHVEARHSLDGNAARLAAVIRSCS